MQSLVGQGCAYWRKLDSTICTAVSGRRARACWRGRWAGVGSGRHCRRGFRNKSREGRRELLADRPFLVFCAPVEGWRKRHTREWARFLEKNIDVDLSSRKESLPLVVSYEVGRFPSACPCQHELLRENLAREANPARCAGPQRLFADGPPREAAD